MFSNAAKHATIALSLLGIGAFPQIPAYGAAPAGAAAAHQAVAEKALGIVSGIHGTWSQMPGNIVTGGMTKGALVGNGSVGVALGGIPEKQEYYIGRDDFWSILRGRVMPVGRLQLTISALQGASTALRENIAPADVTARFTEGSYALQSRSWVADGKNLFVLELQNPGAEALPVRAAIFDAFGHKDRATLSGTSGDIRWLKVSPEVVHATIGGSSDGIVTAPDTLIRSVQVFAGASAKLLTDPQAKPLYAWESKAGLTGASRTADGKRPPAFSCGDIIMPQRRFTVQATMHAGRANGEAVIFSSLVSHRWMKHAEQVSDPFGSVYGHDVPRVQGAAAGFIVYLSQGRLSANLNGTVVTANRPVPLHRWIRVAVAYNGNKMVLLLNGSQVGETTNFPAAAQVMGPKWEWAATHPGDPQIPFDGIAPEGILAMRIIGARVSTGNGTMQFTIPARGRVIAVVAVMDNRDSAGYFSAAISDLQQTNPDTIAASWSHHLAWWRNFWSRSFVEIPDRTVQSWWYGSLYVLASCSRPGNVAPGLWGNWITSAGSWWRGDFTLDYNYEAPFWAAFPTNHVSLAEPYDAPLLAWVQRGRGLAMKLHDHGLIYYAHLAPSPGWSADNMRSLDQKSDALFAAVNCIQRWRYTQDAAYARKMWPFLTGVADFWDHDLKLVNGRYVDFNDAADEHMWGPADDVNPATTIGFLRMLYPALIDMSYQLHTGQDMREIWLNIFSRLSGLPIAPADSVAAIRKAVGNNIPAGAMVILQSQHGMQWVHLNKGDRFAANPPVELSGSSAGMNSLQAVFPAWNVGLESSPALRQAAQNTVNYTRLWYDKNDTSSFYPAAADAGFNPDSILRHLDLLVTHIGYPNFAYNIGNGGIENEATVPTTISAMLLQSYQKYIHVFADWPKNQNASFGNLLAVGDFLVSSRIASGRVSYVRITSRHGGMCKLANPWGSTQAVQLRIAGKQTQVLHGAVLRIPTQVGERLQFTPINE